MGEEPVPIVGAGFGIPSPVRFLSIGENDARAEIALVGVAPDVPVACRGSRRASAGALEPAMLVGSVVDNQFGDDSEPTPLRFRHEAAKVLHGTEVRIDRAIVGDV